MPAEVICLANFKGGVGKSTSTVNIAACLAQSGARTLLADCDPQANASEMFIPEDEIQGDMRSIIVERRPLGEVIQPTRIKGLDVLPASFDLAHLDKELVLSPNGVQRIDKVLRGPRETYDYILLDTGPNLSHLTLGALVAARHIILPVSATVWASTGLRKFLGWVDEHRREEVLSSTVLGLFATMVDTRTRVGRTLLQQLTDSPLPHFNAWIPRRVAVEDAAQSRSVVGEPGAEPDISEAYKALTVELMEKVEVAAAKREGRHAR